jgi:hypothetical protein
VVLVTHHQVKVVAEIVQQFQDQVLQLSHLPVVAVVVHNKEAGQLEVLAAQVEVEKETKDQVVQVILLQFLHHKEQMVQVAQVQDLIMVQVPAEVQDNQEVVRTAQLVVKAEMVLLVQLQVHQ